MKQLDVNNVFEYRNLNKTIYMHIYIYIWSNHLDFEDP